MYHYEQLLQDEGESVNDLPKEIKNKITGIKMLIGKANKAPENSKAQADVQKSDLAIANMIQDWLDTPAPKPTPAPAPKKPTGPTPEQIAAKAKADEDARIAKEKADQEADKQAADNETMLKRNKIVEIINGRSQRYITKAELADIIGKTPDKNETFSDLKLRKIYLTSPEKYCIA